MSSWHARLAGLVIVATLACPASTRAATQEASILSSLSAIPRGLEGVLDFRPEATVVVFPAGLEAVLDSLGADPNRPFRPGTRSRAFLESGRMQFFLEGQSGSGRWIGLASGLLSRARLAETLAILAVPVVLVPTDAGFSIGPVEFDPAGRNLYVAGDPESRALAVRRFVRGQTRPPEAAAIPHVGDPLGVPFAALDWIPRAGTRARDRVLAIDPGFAEVVRVRATLCLFGFELGLEFADDAAASRFEAKFRFARLDRIEALEGSIPYLRREGAAKVAELHGQEAMRDLLRRTLSSSAGRRVSLECRLERPLAKLVAEHLAAIGESGAPGPGAPVGPSQPPPRPLPAKPGPAAGTPESACQLNRMLLEGALEIYQSGEGKNAGPPASTAILVRAGALKHDVKCPGGRDYRFTRADSGKFMVNCPVHGSNP